VPNGNPTKILDAIEVEFDTHVVSEHQPEYWGFDTVEERDSWHENFHRQQRKAERKFEIELLK
jgi:hypothetical protein